MASVEGRRALGSSFGQNAQILPPINTKGQNGLPEVQIIKMIPATVFTFSSLGARLLLTYVLPCFHSVTPVWGRRFNIWAFRENSVWKILYL